MDANEKFEKLAETFYRQTNCMAPGKDIPAVMEPLCEYETRRRFWNYWIGRQAVIADNKLLNEILTKAEAECDVLKEHNKTLCKKCNNLYFTLESISKIQIPDYNKTTTGSYIVQLQDIRQWAKTAIKEGI